MEEFENNEQKFSFPWKIAIFMAVVIGLGTFALYLKYKKNKEKEVMVAQTDSIMKCTPLIKSITDDSTGNSTFRYVDYEGNKLAGDFDEICESGFLKPVVVKKFEGKKKYAFAYISCKEVRLSEWYDSVYPYTQNIAKVRNYKKYAYLDTNGTLISEFYDFVSWDFKNGYARVRKNGKYTYLNPQGQMMIDWADSIKYFTNDIMCCKRGKWMFIDVNTTQVLSETFDEIFNVSEGMAVVKRNNQFGYLNDKAKLVIPLQFDNAGYFHNGYAVVVKGKNQYWVDRTGKCIGGKCP